MTDQHLDRPEETEAVPEPGVPPDPAAYDEPRGVAARARGLAAPYIPGGRDPDPEAASREERRLARWLLAMIVVIVLAGFVLGIVGIVVQRLGAA